MDPTVVSLAKLHLVEVELGTSTRRDEMYDVAAVPAKQNLVLEPDNIWEFYSVGIHHAILLD